MSVNPIGAPQAAPQQQSSSANNWQNVISSVSGTLGMSTAALQQQLQSGQSLSSVAQSQGVSQQALVQSISTALTQGGATAPASQLQQMAANIAGRTASGGHHGHHRHGIGSIASASPSTSTAQTAATSSLLGAVLAQGSSASANSGSGSGSTSPSTASPQSTSPAQDAVRGLSVFA
jgi:hypothetical protein